MEMLAFVCLAIVWAFFLVPPMMRRRREGRPASSVSSFRRQLSTLERATPGTSLRPVSTYAPYRPTGSAANVGTFQMNRSQIVRRRQNVLVALGGATIVTLLLALVSTSAITMLLFLASGGALGAYIYALVQLRVRADEAAAKVRVLRPQARPQIASTPPLAIRRSAN